MPEEFFGILLKGKEKINIWWQNEGIRFERVARLKLFAKIKLASPLFRLRG